MLSCCRPALHLWVAGQVRNDGVWRVSAWWFPAYAGMTVKGAHGMTAAVALRLEADYILQAYAELYIT